MKANSILSSAIRDHLETQVGDLSTIKATLLDVQQHLVGDEPDLDRAASNLAAAIEWLGCMEDGLSRDVTDMEVEFGL